VSNEEDLVAEQVVATGSCGPLTVRISQHRSEEFWRVDVSRERAAGSGHRTATVSPGDNFMMNLIEGAVSGEPVAWQHLAHWGSETFSATSSPAGRRRFG
jgi:hypothetical protein